jgi:hypothetical protein
MYQYANPINLGIFRCMPNERAALLVRLAPELKLKLVELAKRERRSLSKQVEVLLEESLLRVRKAHEDDENRLKISGRKRRTARNTET